MTTQHHCCVRPPNRSLRVGRVTLRALRQACLPRRLTCLAPHPGQNSHSTGPPPTPLSVHLQPLTLSHAASFTCLPGALDKDFVVLSAATSLAPSTPGTWKCSVRVCRSLRALWLHPFKVRNRMALEIFTRLCCPLPV